MCIYANGKSNTGPGKCSNEGVNSHRNLYLPAVTLMEPIYDQMVNEHYTYGI